MIYEHLRVTGTHVTILDCSDLYSISLHGDHVQGFETRWDEALLSTLGILVKRWLNQKISARIFEARNERIETGAPRKGEVSQR